MISYQPIECASDTTAQRCLELIARHAPRLMKAGGGALSGDGRSFLTATHRRQIVALRRAGWKTNDIAARMKVSAPTVSRICYAAGLVFRPRRLTPGQLAEIARLRALGWTCARIADAVGCAASTVEYRLRMGRLAA
jgi:DNA-binding NarL/FixJ family response regulator